MLCLWGRWYRCVSNLTAMIIFAVVLARDVTVSPRDAAVVVIDAVLIIAAINAVVSISSVSVVDADDVDVAVLFVAPVIANASVVNLALVYARSTATGARSTVSIGKAIGSCAKGARGTRARGLLHCCR